MHLREAVKASIRCTDLLYDSYNGNYPPENVLDSKDSHFKAFGPKDPIVEGFWAVLMLREWKRAHPY